MIRMGDPNVLTKRMPSKSESVPVMNWELTDTADFKLGETTSLLLRIDKKNAAPDAPVIDYKRRRQSYRAKMTHLTKRTTIQEHRDIINMRMLMLAEEKGYQLKGEVDRVTTKTTPKEIEDELRRKR